MTETVDTFKNQRIYIRGKVTRRCDTITQNIADLSVDECTNHIAVLNELSQNLSLLKVPLSLKCGLNYMEQEDDLLTTVVWLDRYHFGYAIIPICSAFCN